MGKQWDEFIKKAKYTEPVPTLSKGSPRNLNEELLLKKTKSSKNENVQKTKTKEYDLSGVSQQLKGLQTSTFNPISFIDNNYRFAKKTLGIGNAKKGIEDDLINVVDKAYNYGKNLGDNISKNVLGLNKKQNSEEEKTSKKDENKKRNNWINTSAFDEGITPGNILRAAVNTKRDYLNQFSKGAYGTGENTVDLAFNVASGFTDEKTAKKIRELTTRDFTGEMYKNDKDIDKNSLLGTYLQNVSQAEGNLAAQIALKEAGVPWQLTAFASSAGSEMNNAFSNNASYGQALMSGIISGAVEIGTEYIGGGSNKVLGMTSLGSKTLEKLGGKISNKLISKLAKLGIDAGGEGPEEILSGIGNSIGQRLTYMDEGNLKKLLDNDIDLDEFLNNTISNVSEGIGKYLKTEAKQDLIVGSLAGLSGNGNVILQGNNVNAFTGLTDTQKAAFDKEYNRRIQEIEKDGEKLTSKEKDKIYDEVKNEIETITKIDQFRNNAVENYSTLDDQNRILYNNMINDISSLIKITNSDIRFDQNLNKLNTWNNNTLVINPSMTDMPVKTLFLKELGNNIINEETKSNLIDKLKENGTYDTIKQELLNQGIEEENIDNEIASLELNSIFENNKKLKEFIQNNQEDIQKISSIVNELSKNITQNTKDFNYMNSLSNKINSLNLNKNNLSTKKLQEVKQQEEIEQKQPSTKEAISDEKQQETDKYTKVEEKPLKSPKNSEIEDIKDKQLKIINESNPMTNDYHVGIREKGDIKTFKEAIEDEESFTWGDFTKEDAEKALESGKMTVYSSYPIKNGVFVSTSQNQARDYAGGKKIYSKEVPLNDVAWINGDEGQYAKVKEAKQETKEQVNKKVLNPKQISELKPEDANTTPELKTKKYNKIKTGESKQAETLGKSELFTDKQKQKIINDEEFAKYDKITNKQSLEEAFERLEKGGNEETLRWFNKKSTDADATDIAEGIILMKQYADNKQNESMVEVAKKLRDMKTKTAQALQASSIMSRMTPEGMVAYAQSELDEAYNKLIQNKTKDWIEQNRDKFNLTTNDVEFIIDTMNNVSQMEDGYEKKVELAKIQKLMADKIPPEVGKSIKGWLRLSMLFNPKTQVRNVGGNALIAPVNVGGDVVASWADKLISKRTGIRTTGNINAKSIIEGFKRGAYEATNDYKLGINTKNMEGNRFEIGEGKSFTEKTIIGKGLNRTEGLLNYMMDLGDRVFSEAWFENSLANQMKLNGVDKPTQEMIDIATNEALQRTWNDNNNYTKFVLDVRKMLNRIGGENYGLGDVLIPFAKTPANLTKAIVDYSPAGLVNSLIQYNKLNKAIGRGDFTSQQQHQFVQTLGKATAGTMLYVLGYALAKSGMITGEDDEDKDTKNFLKNVLGVNQYSIKLGDKSFTYDWAQPIAAPLSIMSNIVNKRKNKETALLEGIVGSLDSAGSILMEQSFLQSLNDVFTDNDGVVSGLINEILNLPSRAIPTFSKQIADMVDGTQRQTFEYDKPIQSAINTAVNKIPFLSKTLAPKVNTMGEDILKYGGKNNLFNVMLNPANVGKENVSEAGKEIYRVYKETGNKNIMPRTAPYYVGTGDNKKPLTSDQIAEYQKISGSIVESAVNDIMNTSKYNSLSEDEKASVIKNIVDYAYNYASNKVSGKAMSKKYNKANEYIENGGNIGDYYLNQKEANYFMEYPERYKVIEHITTFDDYKKYDEEIRELRKHTSNDKYETTKYINNLDLGYDQRLLMFKLYYPKDHTYDTQIINYIDENVDNYDDKVEILNKLGFKISSDGTVRW